MEIVLAEDETNLRATLCYAFAKESWTVRDFPDGAAAWAYLSGPGRGGADGVERVVVADITMPRMDGLELCRRVRAIDQDLPWLFLSSRDDEFDRVLGLELGADDYLCKPFSIRELIARIRVLQRRAARRQGAAMPGDKISGPAEVLPKGLLIDAEAYRAWWQGRELVLTVSEFRILQCLAAIPGIVKTREQLQLAAYPDDQYINERSVDCHIKRLRRKLAVLDASEGIETVYGLGYRLCI